MKKILVIMAMVFIIGCGGVTETERQDSYTITDLQNTKPITAILTNTGDYIMKDVIVTIVVFVDGEIYQTQFGVIDKERVYPQETATVNINNTFGLANLDDGYFTHRIYANYNFE